MASSFSTLLLHYFSLRSVADFTGDKLCDFAAESGVLLAVQSLLPLSACVLPRGCAVTLGLVAVHMLALVAGTVQLAGVVIWPRNRRFCSW